MQSDASTYDRFEVHVGDRPSFDAATKERSELGAGVPPFGAASATNELFNTDVWLSMALRLPAGSVFPAGTYHVDDWLVCGQFHDQPDAGDVTRSPVWVQQFSGGVFEISTRSDATDPSTVNPAQVVRYSDAAFPLGTWVRFVHRLQFAQTGNGYLQSWRDGVLIHDAAIPMGYNDVLGPYFRYGAYRATTATPNIVEYANVEVSTTSLLSRVTAPLALPVGR